MGYMKVIGLPKSMICLVWGCGQKEFVVGGSIDSGYGVYRFYNMDMYADKWFKGQCHGCGVHTCEECSKHSCEFKGGVNMSLVTIILGKKNLL